MMNNINLLFEQFIIFHFDIYLIFLNIFSTKVTFNKY